MPSGAIEQAMTHLHAGRLDLAEQTLRRVIASDGQQVWARYLLGFVLVNAGKFEQAVFFLKDSVRAIDEMGLDIDAQTRPEKSVERRGVLVSALIGAGRPDEALAEAERGLATRPDADSLHALAAQAALAKGRFARAREALERALALRPSTLDSCSLADVFLELGRPEQAAQQALRTADLEPTNFMHRATRAVFTVYASGFTPQQVFDEHREVARVLAAAPGPALPVPIVDQHRDPNAPLRVAFLSPDLRNHSVAFFVEPVLEHLDRARFTPIAVYASSINDEVSKRLRARFAAWHVTTEIGETALADLMRRERVDIAIDLAGLSVGSLAYAMRGRVAPVQVTYLGYPHTTAVPNMDARLVDSITDPIAPRRVRGPDGAEMELPPADAFATERLVRLDPCFLCYRPPAPGPERPEVEEPASLRQPGAPVVFGSFNLLGKASAVTKQLWASILAANPGSKLLLKDGALAHEDARADLAAQMAALGVSADRLILLARTKGRGEHLRAYAQVDIALDPTPYNGTTTTCEALLMGVPVITLAGDAHAGRVGTSILSAVGLIDGLARTPFDYVRLASDLARDPERRRELRASLRGRLLASPLCDGPGFTRRFEAALQGLWNERAAPDRSRP